ncbi:hypothetical protein HN011_000106, partial [Eciton burchellii]
MIEEKSFKLVLKKVHPSINLKELKQDINCKGYTVANIWNVWRRITKEFLPILFVELKAAANNKDLYKINFLLQCQLKFEQSH